MNRYYFSCSLIHLLLFSSRPLQEWFYVSYQEYSIGFHPFDIFTIMFDDVQWSPLPIFSSTCKSHFFRAFWFFLIWSLLLSGVDCLSASPFANCLLWVPHLFSVIRRFPLHIISMAHFSKSTCILYQPYISSQRVLGFQILLYSWQKNSYSAFKLGCWFFYFFSFYPSVYFLCM